MNPVAEFLLVKHGSMFSNAKGVPQLFGDALMVGAATGVAGGMLAGAGYGASQVYNAATKGRDFRSMLANNPDLVAEHERDPKAFNQLFSSLRGVNPGFSKDPIIAGTYMRRMVGSPAAGGVLTDALSFQQKERGAPGMGLAVGDSALKGIQTGAKGSKSLSEYGSSRQSRSQPGGPGQGRGGRRP